MPSAQELSTADCRRLLRWMTQHTDTLAADIPPLYGRQSRPGRPLPLGVRVRFGLVALLARLLSPTQG